MTRPRTLWLALAMVVAGGLPAHAADTKVAEPALTFQLKSIDGILADLKYFARLVNQGDTAEQLDGWLAAQTGERGLAGLGIDLKRPFLAYAIAKPGGGTDHPFALMVPISKESDFLDLLKRYDIKTEKGKDGVIALDMPISPAPVYFRFANGYAYFTALEREHLAAQNIVAPEAITVADANTMIDFSVRFDKIPDDVKQMLLGQLELRAAEAKDRQNTGRATRHGIDMGNHVLKTLLSEAKTLHFNWSVDRAKDDIAVSLSVDGKPETMVSTIIGAMGGGKTRFAPAKDASMHIGLNAAIPEGLRPFLNFAVEAGVKDIIARETDPKNRERLSKIIAAVMPTIKAGEFDLHLAATSTSGAGPLQVLAALGVKDGQTIESVAKEFAEIIPAAQRSLLKLDAVKVGAYSLHRIQPEGMDANMQRLFGKAANVWTGFASTTMVIGLGADAAATCEVLSTLPAPVASPLFVAEGSISRLAGLDPTKVAGKAAEEAFGKESNGKDRFRFSIDGGKEFKVSFAIKGLAIKFANLVNERKNGG